MTVHIPIERSVSDAHRAATDDVNRWRGHCLESYARLEFEVTNTLRAMADEPNSKAAVPHNFGDKMKKLRSVIGPGEQFANGKLAKTLNEFDDHLGRRNLLVHATGKVTINAKGEWLWRYQFQPSGKNVPMQDGFFEQGIALDIEKSLAQASKRLGDQLRTLRQKLGAVTK